MDAVPESLIRSIVEVYGPRRIVLFGSRARGEARPDGDLDLLVVLDDDAPAEAMHWRRRHDARRGFHGAVDIIPCREATLRDRGRAIGSFADTVLKEGVVVYERA